MASMNFLSKFSPSKNRVGIFISPRSTIEIVEYDDETNNVINYAIDDLDYDTTTRQITDIDLLGETIKKLYTKAGINTCTPAVLTVPSVLIAQQALSLSVDESDIDLALETEAEKHYTFKKNTPYVSSQITSINTEEQTQEVLYSVIQKEDLILAQEILSKSGISISAIDSSYSSLIRGLYVSKIVNANFEEDKDWCLLIITPNSYVIISLVGKLIKNITEEPIPTKALEGDEVYSTIKIFVSEEIVSLAPESLVVVSQADHTSAEKLALEFKDLNLNTVFVESNRFSNEQLFQCDASVLADDDFISPEVVGTACWTAIDDLVKFNFLSKEFTGASGGLQIPIGSAVITLTPVLFQILVGSLVGLLVVFYLISYVALSALIGSNKRIHGELDTKYKTLMASLPTNSNNSSDNEPATVLKVYENNKKIVKTYLAIAENIPKKTWVNKVIIEDNLSAHIRGNSYVVQDIINYYKKLNKFAFFKNLKIASLKYSGSELEVKNKDVKVNQSKSNLPELPLLKDIMEDSYEGSVENDKFYEFIFFSE